MRKPLIRGIMIGMLIEAIAALLIYTLITSYQHFVTPPQPAYVQCHPWYGTITTTNIGPDTCKEFEK